MTAEQGPTLEYLDPVSPNTDKKLFVPAVGELKGKTIGVATRWGWVGPCLNTDVTKPEVWKTYDPVFDPANKDKICVMDWGDWPILPMALHAGINPYEPLDDKQLNEVRLVLRAMFKNTRTLVGDLTQAQKGLLDGSLLGVLEDDRFQTASPLSRTAIGAAALWLGLSWFD